MQHGARFARTLAQGNPKEKYSVNKCPPYFLNNATIATHKIQIIFAIHLANRLGLVASVQKRNFTVIVCVALCKLSDMQRDIEKVPYPIPFPATYPELRL